MELLDSQANQDSGRKIMAEVGRLAKLSRDSYWRRPSDPSGAAPGTDSGSCCPSASSWTTTR